LAKLERPTDAADKGGWAEMSQDPTAVIEEYLALVNEHLPESISEDVITELRTYMIETARDFGDGETTIKSAKKVVAQFGAPSEVAEEYKYSMLPETIPEEVEPATAVGPIGKQETEQEDEDRPKEPHKDPTVSYSDAVLQGVAIALAWLIVIALASTPLGPVYLTADSMIAFLCQFILVGVGLAALGNYLRGKKAILWKRGYPEWSFVQKLLTLPENMVTDPPDSMLVVDVLGSLTGIVLYFFSLNYSPSPYFLPYIAFPVSLALLAKAFYSSKRMTSLDHTSFIRGEFTSTFLSLLFINSSQIWVVYSDADAFLPFSLVFRLYSIVWGAVLLYQVVTRSGDLWWDVDDIENSIPTEKTEKLANGVTNEGGSTILRIAVWIVLFSIFPTYCLWAFDTVRTPWFALLLTPIFVGAIYLVPIMIYFLYRNWKLKKGLTNSVFGQRSRVEALGDLALSIFLFGRFVIGSIVWSNPNHLEMQYLLVLLNLGEIGSMIFLIGYVSAHVLFLIGLGIRIIGDCLEFRDDRSAATESIAISGSILILTLSLRIGIDILSYNYILFPITMYPVVLLLTVLIAFQVETSRLKLSEIRTVPSHDSTSLHDTALENANSFQHSGG
jgi:hypothetical protein